MKSLFDFIVEPVGERYDNKVKVGDKSLIINTQVETFKSVNNIAKVIETFLSLYDFIKLFFINSKRHLKEDEHAIINKEINLNERI